MASVIENILDNLVTTMASITTGGGYNYTVGLADRYNIGVLVPEQIPDHQFPAVFVVETESNPGGFDSRGQSGPQTLRRTLLADLVAWNKTPRDTLSPDLQKLTEDMTKVVMVDRTRGGYAEMTEIGKTTWGFGTPEIDPFNRVTMQVVMDYRHAKGSA